MTAYDVLFNQLAAQQDRARQLENTARLAYQTSVHQTNGAGWTAPKSPLTFDSKFTTQPAVYHGSVLTRAPDYKHYKFPQCSGGVTRWVIQNGLYVGAYLWFSVTCDPIRPPRTDGSNQAALQAAQAGFDSASNSYHQYAALIAEAQEAIYLLAHPANVVVSHNLLFMATGIKGMPSNVEEELHADATLTPLTVPIYANS